MQSTNSRLLVNRGIGKKYHDMNLQQYPNPTAEKLRDWLSHEGPEALKLGKGINFFGETQDGYDLTLLLARALVLLGDHKLRCLPFYTALEYDTIQDLWEDKPPLIITNFFPDKNQCNPAEYKRLENLLNYYIDNRISLSLHFPIADADKLTKYIESHSLNPVFLDRLLKINTTYIVS
jgi:hypothetical protein